MAFEREYRELGFVPRWTIARTIRQQTVAEHTYFVVLYAMQCCEIFNVKNLIPQVTEYALRHDQFEGASGDSPAPFKRLVVDGPKERDVESHYMRTRFGVESNHYRMWDAGVREIVKFADQLDAVMFICEEWQFGNRTLGNPDQVLYPATSKTGDCTTVADRNCPLLRVRWQSMVEALGVGESRGETMWVQYVHPQLFNAIHGTSYILLPDENIT